MLDSIYSTLSGQMNSIWSAYGAAAGLVAGPLQTGMAINLIICGFAIMRGIVNEPWGAYLSTWLRAQLAIAAATSSFGPWLGSVAWGLPDQLAGAFGGGALGGQFDAFVTSISSSAWAAAEAAPPWAIDLGITTFETPDIIAFVLACVVIACGFIAAAIAMIMALFTKFALAVTIAVGPLFAAGLIFNSSTGMFFSWLGAALNAAVNAAAVAAALAFTSGTIWSFATSAQANGGESWVIYGYLVAMSVIALVGGILVMQAASIASFAGGGGASGSSLVSAVIPSSRTIRSGGRSAGSMGGRAVSSVRAAGRRLAGRSSAKGSGAEARVSSGSKTRVSGASTKGK